MSSILFELDTEVHDGLTVRGFAESQSGDADEELVSIVHLQNSDFKVHSKFVELTSVRSS